MAVRGPRYSKEEFARRGQEMFSRVVEPQLLPEHYGLFLAIDIETGAYELDKDDRTACERLYQRVPDAQPWLMRVGHEAAYRMGWRATFPRTGP